MNEKIKALARQAGFVGESLSTTVFGTLHRDALANFAELIVNECANINFRATIGLSSNDDFAVSEMIREHFGITV